MSKPIITVENLSKKYILSHKQGNGGYTALRDVLANGAKSAVRRLRHPFGGYEIDDPGHEEFWALKDINFEINQGDRVGIIGRNGAGKSTLLKILSRITEPTSGKISMRGRVASLLEVGTGFHPELTGRENIFLNGAIMGMSKWEIRAKFDEIVAFAEVERFLDTPVKRYSSGMYVRLAFAVAAHLEPEILIVDEVLAVGDAQFQKKCLGKMEDVGKEGRTVIFVSHDMANMRKMCNKGVFLESGQISGKGLIYETIKRYEKKLSSDLANRVEYENDKDKEISFISISLSESKNGKVSLNDSLTFQVEYLVNKIVNRCQIVLHLWDSLGNHILSSSDCDMSERIHYKREEGLYKDEVSFQSSLLAPGIYMVTVACGIPNQHVIDVKDGFSFEVIADDSYALSWSGARKDVILALPTIWKKV